jgi:hypothetical protein
MLRVEWDLRLFLQQHRASGDPVAVGAVELQPEDRRLPRGIR